MMENEQIQVVHLPQTEILLKSQFAVALTILFHLYSTVCLAREPGLSLGASGRLTPDHIERPSLPEYKPSHPSEPLVLPPVKPPPEERARLSSGLRVRVRKFKLMGNSVFSDEELGKVTAPYEGRPNEGRVITAEELEQVRYRLSLYYVNRGYINSGALIPDQRVVDGIIRVRIIEGRLSGIEVTGNKRLRNKYITSRLADDSESVLNIEQLKQRLQLLQQSDFIEQINAALSPGVRFGEGILKVQIKERKPYQLSFSLANNRSPSVGADRGEMYAAYSNLLGWGDSISIRYGLTRGADDIGVLYSLPINAHDTTLRLSAEQSDSTVIEEPFDDIDIDSESESYKISLTHPLHRTLWETFLVGLALERRHSKTFLLGIPFSFSAGVKNGESDVTVVRFSQDWLDRSINQVIAMRSTLSWGIDALGATVNASGPDGRFLTLLGQFQWARRFGERSNQIMFRTDLQWAKESMLPLEQCSVGGGDTVRGYRVNQLVRDNCLVSSLELRFPIFRLPIPRLSRGFEEGMVQLAPFADYGFGWNTDQPTPHPKTISSIGLGIRWDPTQNIHAQLYWGYAFQDFDQQDHNLQDDGISFSLVAQLF